MGSNSNQETVFNELVDKFREADRQGKIVYFYDQDHLATAPVETIADQFVEGLLYDLGLDEAYLVTLLNSGDITAINKLAINRVIKYLYNKSKK